jgi:hypothetical protein
MVELPNPRNGRAGAYGQRDVIMNLVLSNTCWEDA